MFAACVFHHIDQREHAALLRELLRVLASGGIALVYEHNPYNPITRHAVNTCPDELRSGAAGDIVRQSREMDRHYAGQARSETLAGPSFECGRYAAARDSDESIWRILPLRHEIGLRRAFQVSGKDARGDIDASVHHNHRSFFNMRR